MNNNSMYDYSIKSSYSKAERSIRLFFAILISWYFLDSALSPTSWHFIDFVDLIIHEAGHWIFMFFGDFIASAGGTISQLLIPLIFTIYFFLKREMLSGFLLFIWFGYNFVNISVYMADAVVMQLPLLGGDTAGHDWHNMLSTLNLLNYTSILANITRIIGVIIVITGAVFAIWYAWNGKKEYFN